MAKQKHVAPPLEDSDDEPQVLKPQNELNKHVLVPKKLQPQMVSKPSSSSEDETDLESESEPEPESEPALENAKRSSKLQSQPASAARQVKSGSKRAAKNSVEHSNPPKREKKAQEDHAAGSDEEDPKKSRYESKFLFQRVFSEKDEIGILKGLSEFMAKTGKEPHKTLDEFYDFMKESNLMETNASCTQLKDKIRRLKKKYENNLAKEKNGKGTTLKPHELEALQLGKNVWGHNGRGGEAMRNEASKKDKKALMPHSNVKAEAKSKLKSEPLDSDEGKKTSELSGTSLALSSMLRYDGTFGKPYGEAYIRKRIELLEASKREEIEARWRNFEDAENKLYAEIAELYAEQAKLIYQANSSSSS